MKNDPSFIKIIYEGCSSIQNASFGMLEPKLVVSFSENRSVKFLKSFKKVLIRANLEKLKNRIFVGLQKLILACLFDQFWFQKCHKKYYE